MLTLNWKLTPQPLIQQRPLNLGVEELYGPLNKVDPTLKQFFFLVKKTNFIIGNKI